MGRLKINILPKFHIPIDSRLSTIMFKHHYNPVLCFFCLSYWVLPVIKATQYSDKHSCKTAIASIYTA